MSANKIEKPTFSLEVLVYGAIAILTCSILGYLYYQIYDSENSLTGLLTIPLITGLIIENRRVSGNWTDISVLIIVALLLSLIAFIPSEKSDFYDNLEIWPLFFVGFFAIVAMILYEKEVTPQLTEGITLLQSIALVYWMIDIGATSDEGNYIFLVVFLIFVAYSFYHAFSYKKLTKKSRLWLSIGSSIIMILFAGEYLYNLATITEYSKSPFLNIVIPVLQYFFLGISIMYMLRNAFMLIEYLPGRSRYYGKQHMADIRAMNKTHVERYSKEQIKIADALLALLFTSALFYSNYTFQLVPRGTMIWLVFWIFPFIILLKERVIA